jgi:hypothetical protein
MAIRNVFRFHREDYETIRRLVPDAEMPESFDDWSKETDKSIAKMKARRDIVVEVVIDPKEYIAYCRASALDHNAATLGAFTVVDARKKHERST